MPVDAPTRFYVKYDPRLVEEAVLSSLAGHAEEARFRRERDRIYELTNEENRETRFRELHSRWFARLRLGRSIIEALEEQEGLLRQVRRCYVMSAVSSPEEGADLHDWLGVARAEDAQPAVILIRISVRRLLATSDLRPWLRHELMHVADMLDPGFGYERWVPSSELGPAYGNLLRDRYRVMWDVWIDGRLHRRGWLPDEAREKRLAEFMATFRMLGSQAAEEFQRLFESKVQTHGGLMALAQTPSGQEAPTSECVSQARICSLCRFPSFRLLSGITHLSEETLGEIRADFPNWQPEQGLCGQCADLYRTRSQSRAAEAMLPRI